MLKAKSWSDAQFDALHADMNSLLEDVEAIDTRRCGSARRALKECEERRVELDKAAARLDTAVTDQASASPIPADTRDDLAISVGSLSHGLLSVLRLQQKSQVVGSLIERKYAYVFVWFSLYITIVLGVLALVLGFFPIWEAWHKKPNGVGGDGIQRPGPVIEVPLRLAVFPIRFALNATGEAGHWSAGVVPGETEVEALTFLVRSLRGCADSTGRNVIRLNVVGFASSAEFKDRTAAQSSALNLDAANRRAREVASLLQNLRDANGLTTQVAIETRPWPTFDAMAEHRPFNDRPPNAAGNRDQEVFNRVVLIEMVGAGSCEIPPKK
jgi:hypothetical protein